jgi:hypothetical protein
LSAIPSNFRLLLWDWVVPPRSTARRQQRWNCQDKKLEIQSRTEAIILLGTFRSEGVGLETGFGLLGVGANLSFWDWAGGRTDLSPLHNRSQEQRMEFQR